MMNFLQKIRQTEPLVFNIVNEVVTNFVANGLLALGASPAMSNTPKEAADLAKNSQVVVLNIGTPTEEQVDAMLLAGKTANEHQIPVILDPVAVGATTYRTKIINKLLETISFSVIRGNIAEISTLNKETAESRGVDSLTENIAYETVQQVAKTYKTIVVATGETDVISDGTKVYTVKNGHHMLTNVTGAGCLLTSVIGAYMSLKQDPLNAVVHAVGMYGIAAGRAIEYAKGPGSFKASFIDELYLVQDETVREMKKIKIHKGD